MNHSFLEDIRAALDTPETADVDLLADIAAEYSEAVVATNRQLKDISSLLDKGLRGEAIQLAETPPDVMEVVASLDFPERDLWDDLLASLGMERPPSLNLITAEEIEEAYGDLRSLDDLLRRHRALAIAKAPLSKRIIILKRLLQKDPGNPGWTEDVETWETARLKQINGDIVSCARRKDHSGVQAILRELNSDWSIPIPTPTFDEANRVGKQIEEEYCRKQLQAIAPKLHDALVAQDVEQGRAAREQWYQFTAGAQLTQQDQLAQETEQVFLWLQECDEREQDDDDYNQAVFELEQSLDRKVTLEELDRLIYAVERFERPMTPVLQTRVNEARQSKTNAQKRSFLLKVAAVVAGIVLIGATTIYFVKQQQYSSKVFEAVKQMEASLESKDYTAAKSVYENLPEKVKTESEIVSLNSQADTALRKKQDAETKFTDTIASIREAGFDRPNFELLKQAEKLAITDQQKQQLDSLDSEVQQRQQELLSERTEVYHEELKVIRQRVDSLLTLPQNGDLLAKVDSLVGDLESMKKLYSAYSGLQLPKITLDFNSDLGPLITKLEKRKADIEQATDLDLAFNNIDASFDSQNPTKLMVALATFVRANPNHPLSTSFTTVASEFNTANYWRGYRNWTTLLSNPSWTNTTNAAPVSRELMSRAQGLLIQDPNIWLARNYETLNEYLKSVAARTSGDGKTLKQSLTNLLQREIWSSTAMIKQKQEAKYYYLPDLPKATGASEYYQKRDLTLAKKPFRSDRSIYFDLAPHTDCVKSLVNDLDAIDSNGWQATFSKMASDIINAKPKSDTVIFDPLVKVQLLKFVLNVAIQGDLYLKREFSPLLLKLNSIDMTDVDWISAGFSETNLSVYQIAKTEAESALKEIGNKLPKAIQNAADSLAKTQVILNPKYNNLVMVGWLFESENEEWQIRSLVPGLAPQELFCFQTNSATRVIKPVSVGQLTAQGVRLRLQPGFISGRPVFGKQ